MKISWTSDQKKVIEERGNNILVSAAAGSGKTAVLSERIVRRIIEDGISIDKMLIMTFTKAAASEMKEKIKKSMENKVSELKQEADNYTLLSPDTKEKIKFLEEQISLVPIADISTVHKFCINVIKSYVYLTDLSPDFREASEGEIVLLEQEILEDLIEEYYVKNDSKFLHLVEALRQGRDDKALEKAILEIYTYARSYPHEDKWYKDVLDNYNVSNIQELQDKKWFKEYLNEAYKGIDKIIYCSDKALEVAYEDEENLESTINFLKGERAIIDTIKNASSFDDKVRAFSNVHTWDKFNTLRNYKDENRKNLITNYRKGYALTKGLVFKLRDTYFKYDLDSILEIINMCYSDLSILIEITKEYAKRFHKEKVNKNIIDFSDMEHMALDILETHYEEYVNRYEEILIDEYQDTSFIQEALLETISRKEDGKRNLFMVGDVKQSIYAFRNSRPEIFTEKLKKYKKDKTKGISIDLHQNFRSRSEVLDSTNKVFYGCMKSEIGDVEYTKEVELVKGATNYGDVENQDFKTEVVIVRTNKDDLVDTDDTKVELEARVVASKISEMVGNFKVTDKDGTLRNAKYSDCAILLNASQGWVDDFESILSEYGIPCKAEKKKGYYESVEVDTILSYLQILDNPYQDIALASVLTSPIGNFSPDEMTKIRLINKNIPFNEAFLDYAKYGTDSILVRKINSLLDMFTLHRTYLKEMPLYKVIYSVVKDTGYEYYILALPDGTRRKANIDILIEEAVTFEGTAYQGLFYFLRYIEKMKTYEHDRGEAGFSLEDRDVVSIVTIHKSKGLEYPIVFIPECGKKGKPNQGNLRFNAQYGMSISAYDEKNHTKYTSPLESLINNKNKEEITGERLRVLYVGMTRAKEKLILIGQEPTSDYEKKEYGWEEKLRDKESLDIEDIASMNTFNDVLMPVVLNNPNLFNYQNISVQDLQCESISTNLTIKNRVQSFRDFRGLVPNINSTDNRVVRRLEDNLLYIYPNSRLSVFKPKLSVSYLKMQKIEKLDKMDINQLDVEAVDFKNSNDNFGALRGTAYHSLMEHLDYDRCNSCEEIKSQIEELSSKGIIDKTIKDSINPKDIYPFVNSEFGSRAKACLSKGLLFREQQFIISANATDAYDEALEGDKILVQGIIDFYMEEDDGIVLLDYKTDNLPSEQAFIEHYKTQLDYYKDALERGTNKQVKEVYIYSFKMKKFIMVN